MLRTHRLLPRSATFFAVLLVGLTVTAARGYFVSTARGAPTMPRASSSALAKSRELRGGATDPEPRSFDESDSAPVLATSSPTVAFADLSLVPLSSLAQWYGGLLQLAPIRTKSVTAGLVFGLSDLLAQSLERRGTSAQKTSSSSAKSSDKPAAVDKKRLVTSVAVGFVYYGPVAHYWYEVMFRLFPAATLVSTLQKAALGQVLFGPCFTCLFFAASLWQSGQLSLQSWGRKIRRDFPSAWLAGLSYWPLVDSISYSLIPKDFIPLFVNMASLVWTVYLSLVANKQQGRARAS